MVARATDHDQRRARSRSSPASQAAASQKIAQHNKRTAESEASPPSVIPAATPYRPSHRVRRPRGTSKPRRVGGVHVLRPLDGVQRLDDLETQPSSPSWRSSASRAATNCAFSAIRTVLVLLISPPSPPALRSQPFFAELAAAGRAPSARCWASHVAPLSTAQLDLLSYLRRRVRYSKRCACASSGEAERVAPPPCTPSPPPAARQHQRSCALVPWPSRGRVAIDSQSMSRQGII